VALLIIFCRDLAFVAQEESKSIEEALFDEHWLLEMQK